MTPLLTIADVASTLKVSKQTVRRMFKAQAIETVVLPGGGIRFHEKEVERMLKERTVPARKKRTLL